jgi:hypothetical protein
MKDTGKVVNNMVKVDMFCQMEPSKLDYGKMVNLLGFNKLYIYIFYYFILIYCTYYSKI